MTYPFTDFHKDYREWVTRAGTAEEGVYLGDQDQKVRVRIDSGVSDQQVNLRVLSMFLLDGKTPEEARFRAPRFFYMMRMFISIARHFPMQGFATFRQMGANRHP